jgi:hypothetical protein
MPVRSDCSERMAFSVSHRSPTPGWSPDRYFVHEKVRFAGGGASRHSLKSRVVQLQSKVTVRMFPIYPNLTQIVKTGGFLVGWPDACGFKLGVLAGLRH